jgi:hypothetical protein
VRLRDGADNNQLSFNTFNANAENGVLIGNSQAKTFYFNNFLAEKSNFYAQAGNNINSTTTLNYNFSGNSFSGFVGNYCSNYVGSDADLKESDTPRLAAINILLSSLSRTVVWFNRLRRHLLPRLLRHLPLQPHTSIRQATQAGALQHFYPDSKL